MMDQYHANTGSTFHVIYGLPKFYAFYFYFMRRYEQIILATILTFQAQ